MRTSSAPALGIFMALVLFRTEPVLAAELAKTAVNLPPFPALEAETLDGKSVRLPEVLGKNSAFLVLGFTKDSQTATSRCLDLLEKDFPSRGYGAAILQGIPFFIKGTVKRAIRKSVPEIRKARYLFLFEGKDGLKSLAGFDPAQEDAAYVLGPKDGRVVFAEHSLCEAGSYPRLKENLVLLLSQH